MVVSLCAVAEPSAGLNLCWQLLHPHLMHVQLPTMQSQGVMWRKVQIELLSTFTCPTSRHLLSHVRLADICFTIQSGRTSNRPTDLELRSCHVECLKLSNRRAHPASKVFMECHHIVPMSDTLSSLLTLRFFLSKSGTVGGAFVHSTPYELLVTWLGVWSGSKQG